MSFVIKSRYALITYAQSDGLDPFDVVNALSAVGAECIIGREAHSDGGTHLHAFVDFGRKFQSRRQDVFDVAGFHPNIQASLRNPQAAYDYAIKDGDVVAGGLERPNGVKATGATIDYDQIFMAPTREEFFETVRSLAPRLLLANFTSLEKYADWHYRVDPEPYRPNPEHVFNTTQFPELGEWVDEYLEWDASVSGEYRTLLCGGDGPTGHFRAAVSRPYNSGLAWRRRSIYVLLIGVILGRGKSLIIYGSSRMGKTEWARSLGPHAYFGGMFSLDEVTGHEKYAVFDDVSFKYCPHYKSWLGQQLEFYCTDKYKKKKLVKWGKPVIWCTNENPIYSQDVDMGWVEANCILVSVESQLF